MTTRQQALTHDDAGNLKDQQWADPKVVTLVGRITELEETLALRTQSIDHLVGLNEELQGEINKLIVSKKILRDQMTKQSKR